MEGKKRELSNLFSCRCSFLLGACSSDFNSTSIMVRYNIIWNESESIPDTWAVWRKPSKRQTEGSFLRDKEIIYCY